MKPEGWERTSTWAGSRRQLVCCDVSQGMNGNLVVCSENLKAKHC